MFTITSKNKNLNSSTYFGKERITFEDGVAKTSKLSDGVRAYLERLGFEVTDDAAKPARKATSKSDAKGADDSGDSGTAPVVPVVPAVTTGA